MMKKSCKNSRKNHEKIIESHVKIFKNYGKNV